MFFSPPPSVFEEAREGRYVIVGVVGVRVSCLVSRVCASLDRTAMANFVISFVA